MVIKINVIQLNLPAEEFIFLFFSKFGLKFGGCVLYTGAHYTRVNTVSIFQQFLPFSSFLSFSEGEIGQAKDTTVEKHGKLTC